MYTSDIRLVVTDLDGTFLGAHAAPLKENTEAFMRAKAHGIACCFASGRLAPVVSHLALTMGLNNCHIIGMNGAQMLRSPMGEEMLAITYTDDMRKTCYDILNEAGCAYNVYTRLGVYTNQPFTAERQARFVDMFEAAGIKAVCAKNAYEQSLDAPTIKFLFKPMGDDIAGYRRACTLLGALPAFDLTGSSTNKSEVMPHGVSKCSAICTLTKALNIKMENVMAFGDFDNDVEMLANVGLSVTMAQCSPAARENAHFVTLANTSCGVAHAVNLLLNGDITTLERGGRQ